MKWTLFPDDELAYFRKILNMAYKVAPDQRQLDMLSEIIDEQVQRKIASDAAASDADRGSHYAFDDRQYNRLVDQECKICHAPLSAHGRNDG